MRNLKRVLSLALACVMVIGMMVMTTGAADFADADEITNVEAVEVMSALGILEGYNGEFNPTGTLTRGQAAKIIAYMLLGEDTAEKLVGSGAFTDTVGHWADPYISYCSNLKIVSGYGDGNFGPDDLLTDLAFGKMVMVALGEDAAQFEGASWATVTGAAMIEMGLVKTATGAQISRDNACALALEGLKYTATPDTYVVIEDGEVIGEFDSKSEAAMYAKLMDLSPTDNVAAAPAEDCLLNEVHDTTWVQGFDAYGRTANVYSNIDWDKDLTIVTAKPVATFTDETMAPAVSAQLKNYKLDKAKANNTYKVEGDVDVMVYTDSDTGANTVVADDNDGTNAIPATVAAGIAKLTGNNKTVEVYANAKTKEITKVVVVSTQAAVISANVEADEEKEIKASVTADGMDFVTDEFVKDDVVIYTAADGEITSMEATTSFTGTLTKFTSKGVYTIDGEEYELSDGAVIGTEAAAQAKLNKEAVYYLGQNGKIVCVDNVKGIIATDGYAVIQEAKYEVKKSSLIGTEETVKAQVKAVLSDGTRAVYNLAVELNDDETKYVVKVNNADTEIAAVGCASEGAVTGTLTLTGIYTYALDGSTITLVKKLATLSGEEVKNGAVAKNVTFDKADAEDGTVIANSETVFILNAPNKDAIIVKTGLAALENTTVNGDAVVNVTVGKNGNTNVAAIVFAPTTEFVAAAAEVDTDDYVYLDGTYTITLDAKGSEVYTATATKADGSTIELTKANVAAGIYLYNAKGEVADADDETEGLQAVTTTSVKVGTIAGTTYKLGNSYMTINDETEIVIVGKNAELEKGATVIYVANENNVVELVYVTKAAD